MREKRGGGIILSGKRVRERDITDRQTETERETDRQTE